MTFPMRGAVRSGGMTVRGRDYTPFRFFSII